MMNAVRTSSGVAVPTDWNSCTLGELTVFSQYGISSSAGGECIVPILKMNNLQDGHIDLTDVGSIEISKDEFDSLKLVRGDLLINRTNSFELVGKAALYDLEGDHVFASYLVRFRLSSSVLPAFVNYYLNSDEGQRRLRQLATKAISQANINPTTLKRRLFIPVPPIAEQVKIVRVLAEWDHAIDLQEQLLAAKGQLKSDLMRQLLSGKQRLPAYAGSRWMSRRLGDLFTERRETGRGDLALLSITGIDGIVPRESIERRDTSNVDKSKYLRICRGDIGYNTMRMWQGVSAVSDFEGIVSPAYTICVPSEDVDVHFMGYLFKSPPVIHLFKRYSQGLVDDTLSLKFDAFSKIDVVIPSRDEQQAIAQVLTACDREMALLERQLAQIRQQKRGLMQRLLSGKVRVSA